ncbi:hypothetical protein JOF54_002317 [Microlunatus capsulatus]|uniref:Uncharacterized protein n=1 Tax=Microlunatus capsulatus TaxID=99117 RepID=A0ABS4Z9H7_9ACTN|nr:hypothetical protein [Microlunatus capsulatus]
MTSGRPAVTVRSRSEGGPALVARAAALSP